MKFHLYLCFIFSVQPIDPKTLKRALKTAFPPKKDGELLNKGIHNNSSTFRRSNGMSYSEVVYNFLDRSYRCGSDKAKEMATELKSTVEAISQLPLLEYFITDTTKVNIINAIKKCAHGSIKNNSTRKAKPKMKARAKKIETYFTGAIENSVASEEIDERKSTGETKKEKDTNSNRKIRDKFRAIVDEVIEGEDLKTDERTKQKLVKVILDIGDNLKSELIKNRELREGILGNGGDGVLSLKHLAFRTNTNPSTHEEDDSETEHDVDDAVRSDNGVEEEEVRREISDDIVLNNNMEIFVRMNKVDGR